MKPVVAGADAIGVERPVTQPDVAGADARPGSGPIPVYSVRMRDPGYALSRSAEDRVDRCDPDEVATSVPTVDEDDRWLHRAGGRHPAADAYRGGRLPRRVRYPWVSERRRPIVPAPTSTTAKTASTASCTRMSPNPAP